MFKVLNWAWWPWVFRVASRSNVEKELQKRASRVLVLSALICAGVSLFADSIIRLIAAPSFWKAAQYVPVLSLAYWFFIAKDIKSTFITDCNGIKFDIR
jgi:O-antigen/teichoic acid export membrane protein